MQHEDSTRLLEFIEASKSKGASDEFLATFLARRGWPQEDVYEALGTYWERTTGLPVPGRARRGESSRDAFLYLLSFSTLATWAGALGSLLFRFIERWLPDPVTPGYAYNLRSAVTWQMASIAVAFPIFLFAMRTILREAQLQPERLESGVRKWLTYIALLLTAGAMICDLIWFVDYFLAGELTSRFLLKALTVMLICGTIFAYYLGSLRWDRNTNVGHASARSLRFAIGSLPAVVVSFSIGLGIAGTPSKQRGLEADNKRIQDLRGIAFAMNSWHTRTQWQVPRPPLPQSLSELIGKGVLASQILDPETRAPYEYSIQSGRIYELCATFSSATEANQIPRTRFWQHGAGRACFTLNASQPAAW